MPNLPSRRLYTLGFALAFGLVAVLGWQGKRTQDALLEANDSVVRSLGLISAVQGTLSALQDVETGMRGYVITGMPEFLAPYHSGRAKLADGRQLLGDLLRDRQPSRAQWLLALDRAIALRLRLAAENVRIFRDLGQPAAAASVRDAGGKQAMDDLRALLVELEAEERALLAVKHAQVSAQFERGRRQMMVGALVVIILLLATLFAIDRNVAARRRLTAQTHADEARQTALLQAIPDTLLQVDRHQRIRWLSAAAEGNAAPLPDGLAAAVQQWLPTTLPGAGVQTFGWHDGHDRDYEVRMVASAGAEHLAILRDVTEATRNRHHLRDQQMFLRNIIDTDENLIFVRDSDGRFALCNQALADVLLLEPAQLEGRKPEAIAGHALLAPLLEGDDAIADLESEWHREDVRIVDAHGVERWLQVLKRPLLRADGRRQVLVEAVDISERRRVERMKNEFVSTVSHELRTPLTAIRGALGMIINGMAGELPPPARPLLDIAYKNGERLVRLINDILDIEKLESGRLGLPLQMLALRPLVQQAIEQNAPYALEFGVAMVLAPGDDARVGVDPDRFAQIMANLLSNAIKHSPPQGTVEISLRRRHGGIELCVADHGEGIPEAFRAQVFERFAQADASDVRRRGGTGLGLAITRSLVQQLGGTIGFDSEIDHGTRFNVWLPEAPEPATAVEAAATVPEGPRILLVESDPATAAQLAEIMGRQGYATVVANDVQQARQHLLDSAIHALVIDLALSDEDGLGFLHQLRSQPAFRHLPVLVMSVRPPTAHDATGLHGGAVGVIDWLRKPLEPAAAVAAVRACLRDVHGQLNVLHVEVDADLRTLVAGLLAGQGVTLHGADSLAAARAQLEQRHHHLVILDLMLPDGDGSELLPELSAARPPTPVIIFSAQDALLPDSRLVLRRLVKSRNDASELAALILENLRHWPAAPAQAASVHDPETAP